MSSSSERVKTWRSTTKQRMIESMGGKCQCCGYSNCNEALAFHHLDPSQKDMNFGATRANPKSWTKIVDELRKCILVCHNCHSEIHAKVREVPKVFSKFDEKFADYKLIGKFNNCPMCNQLKPIQNKFCSHTCAQKNSRKVNWDSIDIIDLLSRFSISELEKKLGVSNAAIYKQRNKVLSKGN